MVKNMTDLAKIRNDWEKDSEEIATKASEDNLLVVCKRGNKYYCLRYFKSNDEWFVSFDCDGVSDPEVVMRWLCDRLIII